MKLFKNKNFFFCFYFYTKYGEGRMLVCQGFKNKIFFLFLFGECWYAKGLKIKTFFFCFYFYTKYGEGRMLVCQGFKNETFFLFLFFWFKNSPPPPHQFLPPPLPLHPLMSFFPPLHPLMSFFPPLHPPTKTPTVLQSPPNFVMFFD